MGKPYIRRDAADKVRGRTRYTADLYTPHMLVGKVLGSAQAHAIIRAVHTEKAKALPGVVAVLTAADAPKKPYTPCGHPYTFVPKELENMHILTSHARFVGDAIAAVVARDEATAQKALALLEVEYAPLPAVFTAEDAMAPGAPTLHDERPDNVMARFAEFSEGTPIAEAEAGADAVVQGTYTTSAVSHCHLEPCNSYAYMDGDGRITIVSSTQIPFLARMRCAQALNIPHSRVRIVKPAVGGGFGNKQDVNQEPLNALMTVAVGGKPVRLAYSREECMTMTRTRYAFTMHGRASATKDGKLKSFEMTFIANGGAYATHNHSIAITAAHFARLHYQWQALHTLPVTVYTNRPSAGAMRGYGAPQGAFGMECMVDDLAHQLGLDPLALRLQNLRPVGYVEEEANVRITADGLRQCLEKGAKLIGWEEKRRRYPKENHGPVRRGVGCAVVGFCSGTVPFNVEISGARLTFNEDATFMLQVGATEIGQGSDTAFAQLAAEVLGVEPGAVIVVSVQDTDVSPYDGGAYATRQTYICGTAVVQAATELREKILAFAAELCTVPASALAIADGNIIVKATGKVVHSLLEVALRSVYDKTRGHALTSDVSIKMKDSAPVFGASFVDLEVDIEACKVTIHQFVNVHDSGRIINRQLAEGQVQGGMSMGLGYALFEQLLFDKDGNTLNNNLLDYKLPTIMDTPRLQADFVELHDATGPLGAKGLGEPPAVSPAPAIRNAILHATGVAINSLPITPQAMFAAFTKAGLIKEEAACTP